jgi:hypothetical protein
MLELSVKFILIEKRAQVVDGELVPEENRIIEYVQAGGMHVIPRVGEIVHLPDYSLSTQVERVEHLITQRIGYHQVNVFVEKLCTCFDEKVTE